jgi:hypothetical protein
MQPTIIKTISAHKKIIHLVTLSLYLKMNITQGGALHFWLTADLPVQAALPPRQARVRGTSHGEVSCGRLVPPLPPRTEH